MLAQAIRAERARQRPFVEINCGSIPESLMESELFGHVKGAFTSAVSDKPGLFELADGGTVFLDEVGELALPLQAKLLKFLDDGQIRRVQGTESITVDVRMIAATNRNLEQEVAEKRCRLDLLHRLNVVAIVLPPLRERPEDVPALARHYLNEHASDRGRLLEWSPETLDVLQRYAWPGNARVVHLTERMVLICGTGSHRSRRLTVRRCGRRRPISVPRPGTPVVEFLPVGSLESVERGSRRRWPRPTAT
jgi:transcriptional regulator with GAF, ATPase, and Fis domain